MNAERNRGCALNGRPGFNVETQLDRMHLLVLCKRNLCSVETDVDSAFIGPQRTAIIPCTDGGSIGEIGVGEFAVQRRVLHVRVAECRNFTSSL